MSPLCWTSSSWLDNSRIFFSLVGRGPAHPSPEELARDHDCRLVPLPEHWYCPRHASGSPQRWGEIWNHVACFHRHYHVEGRRAGLEGMHVGFEPRHFSQVGHPQTTASSQVGSSIDDGMAAARPKVIGRREPPLAVHTPCGFFRTFEQGMKQLKAINALPPQTVDNRIFLRHCRPCAWLVDVAASSCSWWRFLL